MSASNSLLSVADLRVAYGGIQALHGVSLRVERGEIVSVIGANGAGKSTLLKTIAGVKAPASGRILFDGALLPKNAYQVVRAGVTLVPEGRRIFAPLSVRENLLLGAYTRNDPHEVQRSMDYVFGLFPVLRERIRQHGGTLSGGEQQMLAIGRALMSQPKLLLLDEPSLGLAPIIVDTLFDTLVRLNRDTGLSILLVEQNASLALEISHRAYVLETGEIRLEGPGVELLNDPRIRESYLGVAGAAG
jgi:branched-chain amino acid transport system ATP-binding protein